MLIVFTDYFNQYGPVSSGVMALVPQVFFSSLTASRFRAALSR
jgi:hypothetical protein